MIIRRATELFPLYLPESKTPRSPGLHVSNIIRCIATEAGILKPEWVDELSLVDVRTITNPEAILRINIGLAWESHYIPMLSDVVDHPGEMSLDGCYMTHDGESISMVASAGGPLLTLAVHEIKATYKSIKTVGNLEAQFMWLCQMKAYCKGLDTRFAYLHVLFICGDYKFPITPRLEVWAVEFTQEEIDQNWSLLMDYKRNALGEVG